MILRQVVLGAADLPGVSKTLRDTFGLAAGFGDPVLETIGMADETLRVGDEAFLEVVGPLNAEAGINRWLAKTGGGGYALSIQVPALAPILARADGIRLVADQEVYGHRIVQLHPKDFGLLVELDEIADPSVWFWDDIPVSPAPSAQLSDVLGVELTSPDAPARAALWARVLGLPSGPELQLGSRFVRFAEGPEDRMTAVDLRGAPERTVTIGGVEFRVHT